MRFTTIQKLVLITLITLSASVFAEDKINWTGFSGSVMVGRDWGHVGEGNGLVSYIPSPPGEINIISGGVGSNIKGWSGNIKLGYNKQFDNNLIGIELGGTWQNAKSGKESPNTNQQNISGAGCPCSVIPDTAASLSTAQTQVKTYETLSARLGHIFNETTLVYVSGGAALGQIKRTLYDNGDWYEVNTVISDSKTELGYVLGFGVEYKLKEKWSLRGNYEYVDFASNTFNYSKVGGGYTVVESQSISTHFSNLSAGVSYAF